MASDVNKHTPSSARFASDKHIMAFKCESNDERIMGLRFRCRIRLDLIPSDKEQYKCAFDLVLCDTIQGKFITVNHAKDANPLEKYRVGHVEFLVSKSHFDHVDRKVYTSVLVSANILFNHRNHVPKHAEVLMIMNDNLLNLTTPPVTTASHSSTSCIDMTLCSCMLALDGSNITDMNIHRKLHKRHFWVADVEKRLKLKTDMVMTLNEDYTALVLKKDVPPIFAEEATANAPNDEADHQEPEELP